ncbi:MAG: ABC transporter ATP-binding protein [Rhizobiaceae bacterium]|nr:MAG: ABC transporter ATP-binding protein [Rhizobiaceae bacterium]
MSALLYVDGLTLSYGGVRVLHGVSFEIPQGGGIFGLIGPNGAGKTSLLNCISRVQRPTSGQIEYGGRDLMRVPIHKLAPLGITRSFQNLELFDDATVLENVVVGGSPFYRKGFVAELFNLPEARRSHEAAIREALQLIQKLDLGSVARTRVSELPFGTRKAVEFARALAARPRLLLLDEPAAGLNGVESRELGEKLQALVRDRETAILMVEHDMALVMNFCDRVLALVDGEIACEGTPEQVRRNKIVVNAYLGVEGEDA